MIKKRSQFFFIRHGETAANRQGIFAGITDVPLNTLGKQQAQAAALLLRQHHFKSIASSPLSRAFETASIIGEQVGIKPIVIHELQECSFGVMEGVSYASHTNQDWLEFAQTWRDGFAFEQAEHYHDFKHRVVTGVERALELEGPVLVVAHGGVGLVLGDALGLPLYSFDNAVPHNFEPHDEHDLAWRLKQLDALE